MLKTLLSVLLTGKYSLRFIIAVVLSYAFSMAVILGTIGIMDGFDLALKNSLKGANGDISVYHRDSFFSLDSDLLAILNYQQITQYSPQLQTEGYLLNNKHQKAVIVRGVIPKSFTEVTGMKMPISQPDQAILGEELAQDLKVKAGDYVALALADSQTQDSLPRLRRMKVVGTIHHGIYLKDSRYLYVDKNFLQEQLHLSNRYNLLSLNMPESLVKGIPVNSSAYLNKVEDYVHILQGEFSGQFGIRPFWREFQTLIEAVRVQKFSIELILQIIVVIAVFNVLAFLTFLNEKKSLDLFWLQVLGVGQSMLIKTWYAMMLLLWALSSFLSFILMKIFNSFLSWGIFKLPADVYGMSNLSLHLEFMDYVLVFGASLLWALVISWWGMRKFRRPELIQEFRKEFA